MMRIVAAAFHVYVEGAIAASPGALRKLAEAMAGRYGVAATFVDPFARSPLGTKAWLDQVLDFIAEDIAALNCRAEIDRLGAIIGEGTSADRQVDIFTKAKAAGRRRLTALKEVIDWAATETQAGG